MGPERYLDFVEKRTNRVAKLADGRRLCEACARKSTAKHSVEDAPVER